LSRGKVLPPGAVVEERKTSITCSLFAHCAGWKHGFITDYWRFTNGLIQALRQIVDHAARIWFMAFPAVQRHNLEQNCAPSMEKRLTKTDCE